MKKTALKPQELDTPEYKALNAAIERVYQKYGTDLSAFLRDIKELAIKRRKSSLGKSLTK